MGGSHFFGLALFTTLSFNLLSNEHYVIFLALKLLGHSAGLIIETQPVEELLIFLKFKIIFDFTNGLCWLPMLLNTESAESAESAGRFIDKYLIG